MEITEIDNPNKIVIKPFSFTCDIVDNSIPAPLMKKFGFAYLLVGKPSSGKTTMLLNLLCKRNKLYNNKFEKVLLFSPSLKTIKNNPFTDGLPPEQIYDELTDDILEEALDSLEDDEKTLMIFDDVVNDITKSVKNRMKKLIMNRRHIAGSVSIILTTQVYNLIPLPIRKQLDIIFLYPTKNIKEIESVREEYVNFFSKKQFNKVLDYVFDKKHNFLLIKTRAAPKNMLYKNWNKLVINK